ncbi:MAG TPA: phospholipase D family protein [Candidatus Binatia bacterium]|jgi:phosphatidylserine/phosphatidylglycerophosphate/cardiolipin synthase-like enzyme
MTRNLSAAAGLILVTSLTGTRVHADMVVQACFSPQGKCSAHILREIELAKKELLVAVYAFTSDDLSNALVQAKKRGVAVQVVVDREFDLANQNSKGKFFEAQKIPVRRVSGTKPKTPEKDAGLMHQKFAVIDSRIVFTGSYNWTYSADSLNDENLLLFRDAGPLAEEYRKAFFSLWDRKP